MEHVKTENGKLVVIDKIYELKYKFGDSYKYGYGLINTNKENCDDIDIIIYDGGVTIQDIKNVIFIKQIKQ